MTENSEKNSLDGKGEGNGIKVTDRRLFTVDGSLRKEIPDERDGAQPEVGSEEAVVRESAEAPTAETGFERKPLSEPEGVDFTMLINAMAQPALIFLGEVAHPTTGTAEINLEQARMQIDLLDMLRLKCRGNLTPEEEGLLDRILYQLRMLYVNRSSQPDM